ncbi:MAG: methionyl-tRNA formyltransferase [Gemmatimonadales bacterium]
MRVLFFGTPEFAVPSLTALVGEGFDIVGVVTRADKPTGRHRSSLTASPVKLAALAEELTVLQPEKPSAEAFLEAARALKPDISVVVAYGHILKPDLLAVPRLGSVNVHASLLPKLRGAAPIERAILEGFAETGVTIMQMDAGMDTGPILHQVSTPIASDETGGELRIRLAEVGALALVEALTLLDETGLAPKPQLEAEATYAPKLTRAEEQIDWLQDAELVARKIRAFDPAPGAWTNCRGKAIKLFEGRKVAEGSAKPGTVLAAGETLRVACGTGATEACEVQPEGKARMPVRAFVNGRGVAVGDALG